MVFLKSIKKALLVMSAAYICSGLLLVMDKSKAIMLSMEIFAAGFILCGLLSILRYFLVDVRERIKREDFVMGALLIAIGVGAFLISQEKDLLVYSVYVFGMAMFVSAFIKIQDMFNSSAAGKKRFGFYLALFVICAAFGVVAMFSTFSNSEVEYTVVGVGLIFCGFTDILSNFLLAGAIHSYDKSLRNEGKFINNERLVSRFDEHVDEEDMIVPEDDNKKEEVTEKDEVPEEEKPLE